MIESVRLVLAARQQVGSIWQCRRNNHSSDSCLILCLSRSRVVSLSPFDIKLVVYRTIEGSSSQHSVRSHKPRQKGTGGLNVTLAHAEAAVAGLSVNPWNLKEPRAH
ncbi:hypothetical protein AC1031_017052 [Aphanomyces cochlioides]|nr:hypothetical protein AC1031_017052 [Aphanomyces cochlioides]